MDDAVPMSSVGLRIVWHPNPAMHGRRRPFSDGEQITLRRDGTTFGVDGMAIGTLSRQHATLTVRDDVIHVQDLNSRNGTFIDGVRIESGSISAGQTLCVGDLLMICDYGPQEVHQSGHPTIIGDSWAIADVVRQVNLVASQDVSVLIRGETGVGKEVIAQAIHDRSERRGRFIAVNCGAISDGVMHSELFGHTAGAYSGASQKRDGLVVSANDGTLLLDEIGDAPATMQVAMLRTLQEAQVRQVGSDRVINLDLRVVAATHQDLEQLVAKGTFRQDLMMRLSEWVIEVPPLRERPEDIPALARHFTGQFARPRQRLSKGLMQWLLNQPWPGNVRELKAAVRRAVIAAGTANAIEPTAWMKPRAQQTTASNSTAATPAEAWTARTAPTPVPQAISYPLRGDAPDIETLQAAIRNHRGNLSATATSFQVSRSTLYRWLTKLGLDSNGNPREG